MTTPHPTSILLANAPQLRAWWESMDDNQDAVGTACTLIAQQLVATAVGGALPELPVIAPALETLLAEYDDQDQVTLGFVETLLHGACDAGLDLERIRSVLGPTARGVWDDLYRGERRDDLRPVHFTKRDVGGPLTEPTVLDRWLASAHGWVDRDTPLARLKAGASDVELRTNASVWVDRLAAVPSYRLRDGDLLLYLAPLDPKTPKGAQLCALHHIEPRP